VGFIVFISELSKPGQFFGWSNYINTEDNYGCLIEFVSQITKLS